MSKFLQKTGKLLFVATVYTAVAASFDWSKPAHQQKGLLNTKPTVGGPSDLPAKAWMRALKQTKSALKDKELATTAAGLAYYATLAFFPAILGLATVFILFTTPNNLLSVLHSLTNWVPPAIAALLKTQLTPLAHASGKKTGIAAVISIVALLWTVSGGLQNLVKATNKAYDVTERRSFIKLRFVSILLSFILLVVGALIIFLLILQGSALRSLGMPGFAVTIFPILRWPLLVVLISLLLSAIYRYAPDRREPRWQWVSWGAIAATVIWLLASAVFFIYVQNFANFNKSYGSLAGIVVLMVWFNYTSLIILVGAQVNRRLEATADEYPDKK